MTYIITKMQEILSNKKMNVQIKKGKHLRNILFKKKKRITVKQKEMKAVNK